jgi:hypothetical protein
MMAVCIADNQSPVAAQSKILEAPEQEGLVMQLWSKAEGVKAPWRVPGVSPH